MVDAADLKSDHITKITKLLNNINELKVLTFSYYTYTCLTHFWGVKTQQILQFLESDDSKNVKLIMNKAAQTNYLPQLKI